MDEPVDALVAWLGAHLELPVAAFTEYARHPQTMSAYHGTAALVIASSISPVETIMVPFVGRRIVEDDAHALAGWIFLGAVVRHLGERLGGGDADRYRDGGPCITRVHRSVAATAGFLTPVGR
jgi:hypothetical protein